MPIARLRPSAMQKVFYVCPSIGIKSFTCFLTRWLHQGSLTPLQKSSLLEQNQLTNTSEYKQIQDFATALQNAKCFSAGSIAHYMIFHAGYTHKRFLSNLLIDVYGNYGTLQDVLYVFQNLQRKNVYTWNILFSALVQHEQALLAHQLYKQMLVEGLQADKFTYSTMVDASTLMDSLSEGTLVHCMLVNNACQSHVVVATALINMYSTHDQLGLAKHAFAQVSEHDSVSWSVMIEAYAKHGYENLSVHLFQQMQRESVKMDPVALISVLGACATFSTLVWGKIFHSSTIESSLETDLFVGNALVNMYAKCGNIDDGLRVFEGMRTRDVISWTAMISAFNQAGLAQEACKLFAKMQADGVKPNAITFVNILSACSYEGMMQEGILYFSLLCDFSSFSPSSQHYGCLIDLVGRAGRLEEGELLINNSEVRDSVVVWQALLSACKAHNDVDRGIRIAEHIIHLDPLAIGAYVALSDFYLY